MSTNTKMIVGGAIAVVSVILIYETTKKKEEVKSPQQKIAESNRKQVQGYQQDTQKKLDEQRQKYLAQPTVNADPKKQTKDKLQQIETKQYMLNQFNKQVSKDEKAGLLDKGQYMGRPSAQATNQNVLDGLNKLPNSFAPFTKNLKQEVQTRQANQVAEDKYTTDQQNKIAQEYGKLQSQLDRETDDRKKSQLQQKIDNLTKKQDDLDTMISKFNADTASGKNDKSLTPQAQYLRNQQSGKTQKPAPLPSGLNKLVPKQITVKK